MNQTLTDQFSQELQKVHNSNEKAKKDAQRLLDNDEDRRYKQKVMDQKSMDIYQQEKKLKQTQNVNLQKIADKRELKNDKLKMIKKEENKQISQEQIKQSRKMEESKMKVLHMEEERKKQMAKQECDYKQKRDAIQTMKRQKDKQEQLAVVQMLREIEEKAKRVGNNHQSLLVKKVMDTQMKNIHSEDKFKKYQEDAYQQQSYAHDNFEKNQANTHKRLNTVYKDTTRLWKDFKMKHRQKEDKHQQNRTSGDRDNDMKTKSLMNKMQRSCDIIEQFKKDQDHELKLKQELRKLREEDMKKIKDRQKRLEVNLLTLS